MKDLVRRGSIGRFLLLSLACAYTIAPIVVLFLASLSTSGMAGSDGLTTKWYRQALSEAITWQAVGTSLLVAVLVGIISVSLGFCSARLVRGVPRGLALAAMLFISVPAIVPTVVSGFALHAYFSWISLDGSLAAIIAAQVAYVSPIAFFLLHLAHSGLNEELDLCARNLGASEADVVIRIVLPQMRTACIAIGIICALISWDEFMLAWYVGGFNKTMPIVIYSMLGRTMDQSLYAIGTMVTLTSVVLLISAIVLLRRQFGVWLVRK